MVVEVTSEVSQESVSDRSYKKESQIPEDILQQKYKNDQDDNVPQTYSGVFVDEHIPE